MKEQQEAEANLAAKSEYTNPHDEKPVGGGNSKKNSNNAFVSEY